MFIRVYNYNTSELVKAFEAHTDYDMCFCAPYYALYLDVL